MQYNDKNTLPEDGDENWIPQTSRSTYIIEEVEVDDPWLPQAKAYRILSLEGDLLGITASREYVAQLTGQQGATWELPPPCTCSACLQDEAQRRRRKGGQES